MYVVGDYVATSSFNDALESGVNAGDAFNAELKVRKMTRGMRRKY